MLSVTPTLIKLREDKEATLPKGWFTADEAGVSNGVLFKLERLGKVKRRSGAKGLEWKAS